MTYDQYMSVTLSNKKLNREGKAIIDNFLDREIKANQSSGLRIIEAVVQHVIDVGNSWFTTKNLSYYVKKRQNELSRPTNTKRRSLRAESKEEELLFGSIPARARKHLQDLFYVGIGPASFPYRARGLGIEAEDIKCYFDWYATVVGEATVSIREPFPEIPTRAKEKLESLLTITPTASDVKKCTWAAVVGVQSDIALAYLSYLQDAGFGAHGTSKKKSKRKSVEGQTSEHMYLPTPISLVRARDVPEPPPQASVQGFAPLSSVERVEHVMRPRSCEVTASMSTRSYTNATVVETGAYPLSSSANRIPKCSLDYITTNEYNNDGAIAKEVKYQERRDSHRDIAGSAVVTGDIDTMPSGRNDAGSLSGSCTAAASVAPNDRRSRNKGADSHTLNDVQPALCIEQEPPPETFHELLEWMDKYQGPLDEMIRISERIKAATS